MLTLLQDNIFNVDIILKLVHNAMKVIDDRVQSSSSSDFILVGGPDAFGVPYWYYGFILLLLKELLNTNVVLLTQAEIWKKEGLDPEASNSNNISSRRSSNSSDSDIINDNTNRNQDQQMHMDFPNHTILHPPPFPSPEAIACIIYLSDSEEHCGATHIFPRLSEYEQLYQWPYSNMPGF